MKTIIVLLSSTLLINFTLSETDNFQIENGQVLWQKVFETNMTKEQLIEQIKSSGQFENISENEKSLTAQINQLSMDFKGYGISEMSTPMYVSRSYVEAFSLIEFKEKRYRVTLKNIKFVQKYEDALSKEGETTDIEFYALKKRNTEFKSNFLNKPSKIMDFTFQKITNFKDVEKEDKW
ncbi:hypothetical protein J8L85_05290 [Maribacter sp. MMG018]|uniref:hypothetical protein n=1 Tax=Maribacter sp. MMG018 TaxID=2822688 RepID=UPI001B35E2CC|nr:hypothetical protein [Maribacter sp. MMG018]MBQ4913841.1 hypothetical protein [Maribacter sp. MMG018]